MLGAVGRSCQESWLSLNTLLANCRQCQKASLCNFWLRCHCLQSYTSVLAFRDNLQQAIRADAEVDRKIEINTQNFEALDFNAAASKSGMRPGDAFGSTIRGAAVDLRVGNRGVMRDWMGTNLQ